MKFVSKILSITLSVVLSCSLSYADDVRILLHMNGTDASTTFTDDSPVTPHTFTAGGDAQIDTGITKFGSATGLFDGDASEYLSAPDNADFDVFDSDTSDVTIHFWWNSNEAAPTNIRYFMNHYTE